jgi:hypothetical protein
MVVRRIVVMMVVGGRVLMRVGVSHAGKGTSTQVADKRQGNNQRDHRTSQRGEAIKSGGLLFSLQIEPSHRHWIWQSTTPVNRYAKSRLKTGINRCLPVYLAIP